MASETAQVVNIAAYRFVALERLAERRGELRRRCRRWGLKGTILLAPEGINLFVAGSREAVDALLAHLRSDPALADLTAKESLGDYQPFNRMLVRLKKEIIAFGVEGIEPQRETSPKLPPTELKKWLDHGTPLLLLDTRNDYEVELGTFRGSQSLNLNHFRDFPQAVRSLPEEMKERPVVMFCTGGIRCEKAGPLLQREGFGTVYQLDGGILKYFEQCGDAHWQGECFVFDQRVALDPQLRETATRLCFACQATLSSQDQRSETYVPGVSCPHCYRDPRALAVQTIVQRHARLREVAQPLPGSIAYDNERPVSVPLRFDRVMLLDFLDEFHPHLGRENWRSLLAAGRITYQGAPAAAERIVRAGERYVHLQPAITEPDVNAGIEILYEDEALVVVNKPAPLPMHPCGRFNRNSLLYLLNQVYAPQRLRSAHRLDANTSGILVLTRTRSFAAQVQRQFERRSVEKVYLARVLGRAAASEFVSEVPIGETAVQAGVRLAAPAGLSARTEFRVLQELADGTSLIEARPITGRTNQIRLHLWGLGLPICGDPVYLPQGKLGHSQTLAVGAEPLCLHARRISFSHPTTGERLSFEAPLPAWTKLA